MHAVAIKQKAIEAIQRLPDLTDVEEIMYRLYVLESIRRGREDAEQGDTTPADDVIVEIRGKPETEGNGDRGKPVNRGLSPINSSPINSSPINSQHDPPPFYLEAA